MKPDPAQLRLFIEVLEAGSITAGAGRCHLSVAAASSRLQELESTLGVRLFERHAAGVRPTDAGLALADHARSVMVELDRLRREMAPYAQGVRARVSLLANSAALAGYVPEPLAHFLGAHPEVDVDLQELWSGEIVDTLRRRKADLGVLADTLDTSGLHTQPLAEDQLLVVGTAQRLATLGDTPCFEQCLEQPLVGLSAQSALHTYLQVKAADLGKVVRYRVSLRSFEGVLRMAALDAGLGIVSSLATRELLRQHPKLQTRSLSEAWTRRRLILCTHHAPEATPAAVRALMRALQQPPTAA
jgi:DNA-binding transcriptional LysR family regulator